MLKSLGHSWYMILSRRSLFLSFVSQQRYMLIFSIYFATSNEVSLSSNAIQILWPCACVNSDTCPSSILLLLSSSPLFFKRTRIHEYDDSLYLFSFCFRGMTSFCMIDHDGQWLMSCTYMIKVRNVHSITWEAIGLNELKMYKIAMWNHRNYSHMYVALVVFEHKGVAMIFVFNINTSKSLN